MAEKYVVSGARLKCSNSSTIVRLNILRDRHIHIEQNGNFIANKSDVFPDNIRTFGQCQGCTSDEDENGDACSVDSAGRGGRCIREGSRDGDFGSFTPWLGCKEDVLIAGQPAVLESSYIWCLAGGGKITVADSGQEE